MGSDGACVHGVWVDSNSTMRFCRCTPGFSGDDCKIDETLQRWPGTHQAHVIVALVLAGLAVFCMLRKSSSSILHTPRIAAMLFFSALATALADGIYIVASASQDFSRTIELIALWLDIMAQLLAFATYTELLVYWLHLNSTSSPATRLRTRRAMWITLGVLGVTETMIAVTLYRYSESEWHQLMVALLYSVYSIYCMLLVQLARLVILRLPKLIRALKRARPRSAYAKPSQDSETWSSPPRRLPHAKARAMPFQARSLPMPIPDAPPPLLRPCATPPTTLTQSPRHANAIDDKTLWNCNLVVASRVSGGARARSAGHTTSVATGMPKSGRSSMMDGTQQRPRGSSAQSHFTPPHISTPHSSPAPPSPTHESGSSLSSFRSPQRQHRRCNPSAHFLPHSGLSDSEYSLERRRVSEQLSARLSQQLCSDDVPWQHHKKRRRDKELHAALLADVSSTGKDTKHGWSVPVNASLRIFKPARGIPSNPAASSSAGVSPLRSSSLRPDTHSRHPHQLSVSLGNATTKPSSTTHNTSGSNMFNGSHFCERDSAELVCVVASTDSEGESVSGGRKRTGRREVVQGNKSKTVLILKCYCFLVALLSVVDVCFILLSACLLYVTLNDHYPPVVASGVVLFRRVIVDFQLFGTFLLISQ